MPKANQSRRHQPGAQKRFSMAEMAQQVAVDTGACRQGRLVHADLSCGCPADRVILLPVVDYQPAAPTTDQLAALIERVDVTSTSWPEVREGLTAALAGDALA